MADMIPIANLLERLDALQAQRQAARSNLDAARQELESLSAHLAEAKNKASGCKDSSSLSHQALYAAAQADIERLTPLVDSAQRRVAAGQVEHDRVQHALTAIVEGSQRLAIAQRRYQRAVATEAEARNALQDVLAKQAAATHALIEAKQASAAAERVRAEALDTEAMTAARADLDAAQRKVDDNQVLCDNLQRRVQALTAALTKARTEAEKTRVQVWEAQRKDGVDAVRAQMEEPLRTAFAAAVCAGKGGHFAAFVADVFCPDGHLPEIDTVTAHLAETLGVPARSIKWPAVTG